MTKHIHTNVIDAINSASLDTTTNMIYGVIVKITKEKIRNATYDIVMDITTSAPILSTQIAIHDYLYEKIYR